MALAFGVVGFMLSFGAAVPGYDWLYDHVPLLQGIRAAARWGMLALMAIAILAGFASRSSKPAGAPLLVDRRGRRHRRPHHGRSAARAAFTGPLHGSGQRTPAPDQAAVTGIVVFPLYGGAHFNWQCTISAGPDSPLEADGQRLQQFCA